MELFEYLNILFTDPSGFLSVSSGTKKKHFYMCNRRLAIGHPLQVNALQHIKINPVVVMDFWQEYLNKQYRCKMPGWMYLKGAKKNQESIEKKQNVSNQTIRNFCKIYKIDEKTIKDAIQHFPEQIIKELKQFEKLYK